MPRPAIAPVEDRRLLAIGLMLAALLGFTGIDTCAKWLILEGVPTAEVVFVRYLVNLLLVIAVTLPLGEPLRRDAQPRRPGACAAASCSSARSSTSSRSGTCP